ncbi:hypothetical protein [Sphaerimonospora thailandensis]|uniref:hypothetical protein n=1 Tax=Sphaerimonospora thailandensis TaxID=795644 RepID=UPI00194FBA54
MRSQSVSGTEDGDVLGGPPVAASVTAGRSARATPWAGSSRPSAATSTPARTSSSLKRPTASSICSMGVSIILAMDSSVPRMISMYFAVVDLLAIGVACRPSHPKVERGSRKSTPRSKLR